MPADIGDDEWVEVALFYVSVPRHPADPETVRTRAEIIYGEGAITVECQAARMRVDKLGDGLRVLRLTNRMKDLAAVLERSEFDHRDERFTLGLLRRPPIAGLAMPRRSGILASPVDGAYRFVQFVRIDKLGLVQRISSKQQADDTARIFIDGLLDTLAKLSGCELRGDHLQWLGDVVVAERVKQPVTWEPVPSANGTAPRALNVHVKSGITGTVHAQLRITSTDGMCICDRLLQWQPGANAPQRIELLEDFGGVFLRVWIDSDLVLEEQRALLRGFMGTVEMAASSWTIKDRLTRKLAAAVEGGAADPALLVSAQKGQSTALSTKVGSQLPPEPWTGLNRTPQIVFDYIRPKAPDYGYFPKGATGRTKAILHFAGLVSKAEQAYLIDPWFDATGAEALLPRVSGDVHLTVVTNLPSAQHVEHRDALDTFLRSASVMGLPENLQVLCVSAARRETQLFHDRFLLLKKKQEDAWQGFVLTNSFSGLATEYSLFVVEAGAGTTAMLLAELEGLLDLAKGRAERVWPPDQAQSIKPINGNRGTFPYWRSLLRALVPRWWGTERAWLLVAQSHGFLVLKEDGVKWLMKPEARLATLRILLGATAVGLSRKKTFLRAGRRRGATQKSRMQFPIGKATLVLGELVARGFAADAHDIASKLGQEDARRIERALRRTFDDDTDPARVRQGDSRERMGIRQSLDKEVPLPQAAWTGLSLWNSPVFPRGRKTYWDRCFAYAVLSYLEPERAVRLCEELQDADFILALLGNLQRRIKVWSEELAIALLRSTSPVLRAVGAQALSHSSFEGQGEDTAPSLADCRRTLQAVRDAGWSEEEVGYLLGAWGIGSEDLKRRDLIEELARVLEPLDHGALARFAEFVFQDEVRSLSFLERLVDALLLQPGDGATDTLEALVSRFAQRFHLPRGDFYFTEVVDLPLTEIMARCTAGLVARRGTTATLEIERVARTGKLRREFERATPLRWRTTASTADAALGWIILWDLIASTTRTDFGVAAPEPVVQQAVSYLMSPVLRQSSEIRACVRGILGPAAVAAPIVEEDDD